MTVSLTTNRVNTAGNGSTTVFPFNYPYRAATDLRVILKDNTTLVETLQVLNTDYTLAGVANANTGGFDSANITMVTAPAVGKTLIINRGVPLTSSYDPTAGGTDTAPAREGAIDRLTLQLQTLREMIARAPLLPEGNTLSDLSLPNVRAAIADELLAINASGTGFTSVAASDLDITLVSGFMATLLDDADAAAARQTLLLKETFIIAVSDETTVITTGTAKVTFRMPYAFTLSEIPRASLTAGSSSGLPTVDINKSGATILSTKLSIDANEKTSTTATTPAVLSSSTFTDDEEVTIDIDVAGTNATGLKVYLTGYRTGT